MEKLNLGSFKNSTEWKIVERKIHEKRRVLKRLHDELIRLGQRNNYSKTIYENKLRQYRETAERLRKEVLKENKDQYIKWVNRILDVWRVRQIKLLKVEFYNLIPNKPVYIIRANENIKVYISPEESKKQADVLVAAIVNTVFNKLRSVAIENRRLPLGGNLGNFASKIRKGEVQCADNDGKGWSDIIGIVCEKIVNDYSRKNKNSFWMIWKQYGGDLIISDAIRFSQHNWLEFRGAKKGQRVIIDPWPSGGKEILSKEPYKDKKGCSRNIYPELTTNK